MDLLLDTNALLWALLTPRRLRPSARAAIEDRSNRVSVSAVSAWELAIKAATGKLAAPDDVASWLPAAIAVTGFTPLSITMRHSLLVERLPLHHRDPFDRLLIAQAMAERLTIVTADPLFDLYGVPLLRT